MDDAAAVGLRIAAEARLRAVRGFGTVRIVAVDQPVAVVVEPVVADLDHRGTPCAHLRCQQRARLIPLGLAAGRIDQADRVAAVAVRAIGRRIRLAAVAGLRSSAIERLRVADEPDAIDERHRVVLDIPRILDADRVGTRTLGDRHDRGDGLPTRVTDGVVAAGEVDPLDREEDRVVDRLDREEDLGTIRLDQHDAKAVVELRSDVLGPLLGHEVVVEGDREHRHARLHDEVLPQARGDAGSGRAGADVGHPHAIGRNQPAKALQHRDRAFGRPEREGRQFEAAVEGRLEEIQASVRGVQHAGGQRRSACDESLLDHAWRRRRIDRPDDRRGARDHRGGGARAGSRSVSPARERGRHRLARRDEIDGQADVRPSQRRPRIVDGTYAQHAVEGARIGGDVRAIDLAAGARDDQAAAFAGIRDRVLDDDRRRLETARHVDDPSAVRGSEDDALRERQIARTFAERSHREDRASPRDARDAETVVADRRGDARHARAVPVRIAGIVVAVEHVRARQDDHLAPAGGELEVRMRCIDAGVDDRDDHLAVGDRPGLGRADRRKTELRRPQRIVRHEFGRGDREERLDDVDVDHGLHLRDHRLHARERPVARERHLIRARRGNAADDGAIEQVDDLRDAGIARARREEDDHFVRVDRRATGTFHHRSRIGRRRPHRIGRHVQLVDRRLEHAARERDALEGLVEPRVLGGIGVHRDLSRVDAVARGEVGRDTVVAQRGRERDRRAVGLRPRQRELRRRHAGAGEGHREDDRRRHFRVHRRRLDRKRREFGDARERQDRDGQRDRRRVAFRGLHRRLERERAG